MQENRHSFLRWYRGQCCLKTLGVPGAPPCCLPIPLVSSFASGAGADDKAGAEPRAPPCSCSILRAPLQCTSAPNSQHLYSFPKAYPWTAGACSACMHGELARSLRDSLLSCNPNRWPGSMIASALLPSSGQLWGVTPAGPSWHRKPTSARGRVWWHPLLWLSLISSLPCLSQFLTSPLGITFLISHLLWDLLLQRWPNTANHLPHPLFTLSNLESVTPS